MFTDAEFMSAREKQLVLNSWKRFWKAALKDTGEWCGDGYGNKMPVLFKAFSKNLYDHLHLHCGHIAHYNIGGFFQEWCETPQQRLALAEKFLDEGVFGGMSCMADYRDLNKAMAEVIRPMMVKLEEIANATQYSEDMSELHRLAAKTGTKFAA